VLENKTNIKSERQAGEERILVDDTVNSGGPPNQEEVRNGARRGVFFHTYLVGRGVDRLDEFFL